MFKDTILTQLNRLVTQLDISPLAITFRDKTYAIAPGNEVQSLTGILYSECYALKETYQSGLAIKEDKNFENNVAFIEQLCAGNKSKDRTEQGWYIKNNYANGYFELVKNGQTHIAPSSAIKANNNTAVAGTGHPVAVFFAKEDRHRQPAFYYVFSNHYLDTSKQLTRIYYNITAQGAPVLVNSITTKLNKYNIPFLFKCLNHPQLYFRRDAAVLYIEDSMMPIVSLLLPEIYEDIKPFVEEDVPLFAYKYLSGIGIAESPNAQESFGMNRMANVANVLMALPRPLAVDYAVKEIANAFLKKGIHPDTPFLNKGSKILFN